MAFQLISSKPLQRNQPPAYKAAPLRESIQQLLKYVCLMGPEHLTGLAPSQLVPGGFAWSAEGT